MDPFFRRIATLILPFLSVGFVSCSDHSDIDPLDIYIETSIIWDKSPHCAFTDLVEYKGRVYCCFREANKHVPDNASEYGCIRIVETTDGNSWKSIGTVSDPDFDLRDPKLTVTPDSRLMLLYGRSTQDYANSIHPWTMAKFISDEEISSGKINNENSYEISIDGDQKLSNYWLWRIKWIGNTAYGIAYKNDRYPILVKSTDGINFSVEAVLDVLGNEADIEILPDGRMLVVMRAQNGNGFIGLSYEPFDKWEWIETSNLIHCPAMLTIDNKIYVAGRSIWGTMLFGYRDTDIEPLVLLPIGGCDNAYPGIICRDNQIWISYYGESNNNISVYLSKIPLEELVSE